MTKRDEVIAEMARQLMLHSFIDGRGQGVRVEQAVETARKIYSEVAVELNKPRSQSCQTK